MEQVPRGTRIKEGVGVSVEEDVGVGEVACEFRYTGGWR